jgi:hypothetical protein
LAAGGAPDAALPPIPEIQLVASRQRFERSAKLFGKATIQNKTNDNHTQRRNGFVVTDYESNPRFESRRRSENQQDALVNSDGNESAITKALKTPGQLFSNISKSFLRGDDDPGKDGSENKQTAESVAGDPNAAPLMAKTIEAETTDEEAMKNALDEIIAPETKQNNFDDLNQRIVGQNLAIGLLTEDFYADDAKSIEFLSDCVDRLERLSATHVEISEQIHLFAEDQQNEFTELHSLEEITTELMTAVNEADTLLSGRDVEGEDASLAETLGDLRLRLSQVLAEHAF